mmetsp:Transcript_33483/g.66150  ORF Transcript_33483/g.66150 Transcript_33483/m.66150 type:complete len:339 (+) Transcript_33483:106-1122(+)
MVRSIASSTVSFSGCLNFPISRGTYSTRRATNYSSRPPYIPSPLQMGHISPSLRRSCNLSRVDIALSLSNRDEPSSVGYRDKARRKRRPRSSADEDGTRRRRRSSARKIADELLQQDLTMQKSILSARSAPWREEYQRGWSSPSSIRAASQWQVAVVAGCVLGISSLAIFTQMAWAALPSLVISSVIFLGTFVTAMTAGGDNIILGSLAQVVGLATIRSAEGVGRVMVGTLATPDDRTAWREADADFTLLGIDDKIKKLEWENELLREELKKKAVVDDILDSFGIREVRNLAKEWGIETKKILETKNEFGVPQVEKISVTKAQLLYKLVDCGAIEMPQ